jgi:hypothetical protein
MPKNCCHPNPQFSSQVTIASHHLPILISNKDEAYADEKYFDFVFIF